MLSRVGIYSVAVRLLVIATFGLMGCSQLLGLKDLVPGDAAADISSVGMSFVTSSVATSGDPREIAIADFNGDGKPDLMVTVIINPGENLVIFTNTTMPGDATASFGMMTVASTGGSQFAGIADFNGDGLPDLAVVDENANVVSILLNTTPHGAAAPTFGTKTDFPAAGEPGTVVVGDFDGDGKPDVASSSLLLGSGGAVAVNLDATAAPPAMPSFGATKKFPAIATSGLVVADVDHDGKPDLVLSRDSTDSNEMPDTITVLLNNTVTGLDFTAVMDTTVGMFASFAVADLDGDHLPEIVLQRDAAKVEVLHNTSTVGQASFTTSSVTTAVTFGFAFALGDIDGDGLADLVLGSNQGKVIDVELNRTVAPGAYAFSSSVFLASSNQSSAWDSIAIADLDGDHKADIVVTDANNAVVIALQR